MRGDGGEKNLFLQILVTFNRASLIRMNLVRWLEILLCTRVALAIGRFNQSVFD